jgi:AraC-like DNA-binding protein
MASRSKPSAGVTPESIPVDPHRAAVARVIRAMRDRPASPFALGEMASLGFLSPFYFTRVFRAATGIPPGLFQSALRFESAKRLLLTTALPATEICDRLSFQSAGTFARQFKARVGVSPEHLRRLARGAPLSLAEVLGRLEPFFADPRPGDGADGSTGEVVAPPGFLGLVVVALFRKAVPEGWPVACAMRSGGGAFRLPLVADGSYFLFAAGIDRRTDLGACLIQGEEILRSEMRGRKVAVEEGRIVGLSRQPIRLRPADDLDPPVLFALPALLLESVSGLSEPPGQEARLRASVG